MSPTTLLACMRDCAATSVEDLEGSLAQHKCPSVPLPYHVGEQFETPVLDEYVSGWMSHRPRNKAFWHEQTGRSMKNTT